MVESMARVNKSETDYEPFRIETISPGRLSLSRSSNPFACAFTVGFVEGPLRVYGHKGWVTETRCRWLGDEACLFEAELTKALG
jgi:predicted hydrocarbon binding protein